MKLSSLALLPLAVPLVPALPTDGSEKLGPRAKTIYSDRHPLAKRSSISINSFLALVTQLFPVNIVVSDISGLITTGEKVLAGAAGIDTNENDINNGNCGDMIIIFSRGTTETGNVGALAGPPFFDAVKASMGASASLAVQGVDYPADVTGFLQGGSAAGSQTMANLVTKAFSQCPSSKIVMSGYSQGGQLVHNAAKILPASTMMAVSSVVIFGDPNNGTAVQNTRNGKTLVVCHDGDNICQHGDLILLPHLTYATDANTAANFVVASAGAIGK